MKKSIKQTAFCTFFMILFTVNMAQTAPPPAITNAPIVLDNLPTTCLPEKGRMLPDPAPINDMTCHCPPVSMCSQTITHNGKTLPKLPRFISDLCCPTPLPPCYTKVEPCQDTLVCPGKPDKITPRTCQCVTVNEPCQTIKTCPGQPDVITPKTCSTPCTPGTPGCPSHTHATCDLVFFNDTDSGCPDRTFVGARVAKFCANYNTTNAALNAQITAANNCFDTRCKPLGAAIKTNYRGAYDLRYTGGKEHKYIDNKGGEVIISNFGEYNANIKRDFDAYINCRDDCYTTHFAGLKPAAEAKLTSWLKKPLLNVHIGDKGDGTQNHDYGDHTASIPVNQKNMKILTLHRYSTFEQSTFADFVNTTTPQQQYAQYYSFLDNHIEESIAKGYYNVSNFNKGGDDLTHDDNYINYITANGYKNTEKFFPGTPENTLQSSIANVNCVASDEFDFCLSITSNDSTCHSCLSPETKITLADNSTKQIKDLKAGDAIKAPYDKTGIIKEVVNIKWPKLELYNINNGQLRLTADHPIMTTGGWRAINYNARKDDSSHKRYGLNTVDSLKVGDVIVTENGDVPVTSMMPETPVENGETFNLKLKDNINGFYANGMLVKSHN